MGSLRFASRAAAVCAVFTFLFLPACGGHKPAGQSPFPAKISLSPAVTYSMQVGTILQLTATAQNNSAASISPTFTYGSSNPGVLDIAPNGAACAGTWNAPLYSKCTAGGIGTAQVTATALGATSAPTLFFVHPPIDNIQISVVPPSGPPPAACPSQTALPAACNIQFKSTNACLSANQSETLQATAFSGGIDVTSSVGPFSWSQSNGTVLKITPVVDPTITVATNQITVSAATPGETEITASVSGMSSAPYPFAGSCPVTCIALELGVNGSQLSAETSFVTTKGTSQTITSTAVDVQGCIVPKPSLTWTSSEPASLSVGAGCPTTANCTVTTLQPGVAAITASCTPPSCNAGFPLNPANLVAPYVPEPVYPVTAISGLVTGATVATTVAVTSRDCSTDETCAVALYNLRTSSTLSGGGTQVPLPPNSLLFDGAGDKAFAGGQFGAFTINPANLGGTSNPFAYVTAPGTPLGLATGKVLAVSRNGGEAVFSDTISTPNQVYVASASGSSANAIALNIAGATAAAISPDELKSFILGDGGNTLNVYSTLQFLQAPIALPAPATSVVFSSTGAFALLAGGGNAGSLAAFNTCDNSAITPALGSGTIPTPPLLLQMVPAGNVPMGTAYIPALQTEGLDIFFGVDNTGIDIIATTSSLVPLPATTAPVSPPTLCPRPVVLAQTTAGTTFAPIHIGIGQGTFHPISFFLSPDSTQVYIVTTDFGVLIYNFNTRSSSRIPLINNAAPLAADMTLDGTLIYVAASDGTVHVLNTASGTDQQPPISFAPLPNSSNNFCYTGAPCEPDILAVKP